MTCNRGVMDVDADLKGLKFRMAARILLATAGRVLIRTARQLRVASMSMGSLQFVSLELLKYKGVTHMAGS